MAVTRRSFLGYTASLGAASLAVRAHAAQPDQPNPAAAPWSPITPDALAREVVGASHGNLDRVKELVTERPELAKAVVDWGLGDFETAIGAASHVGNREIADFLMSWGARPDIFTFAMLGNLAAVRAIIEAMPGIQRLAGPHSLTLMSHARAGGEQAASVVEYLATLEGADDAAITKPVDNPSSITGSYTITDGATGTFEIAEGRRGLEFRMAGYSNRNLVHVGDLEFFPVGAKSVRFKFIAASAAQNAVVAVFLGDRTLQALRA